MGGDGSDRKQITNYVYDTQILNPHYSPDGNSIVFAMADKEANLDLFILELASGDVRSITDDPAADYDPVWHPGGDFVSYTSHASSTPNIHTVNITTGASKQVSDVGDAVWVAQWSPVDSSILATTLPDVDTVRIVNIKPHRSVTTQPLAIRSHYSEWRSAGPATPLINIDPQRDIDFVDSHSYKPFSVFRHQGSLIFPAGIGIFGLTQWSDAMTRHLYTGIGIADFSKNGTNYLFLQYANAMGGPLWGINLSVNMNIKFKPYDQANWGLMEENSSFGFWFQMPYNFGENLSNNHLFSGAITLTDRNANLIKGLDDAGEEYIYIDSTKNLPMPLSGAEALFSASHMWVNRRSHKNNSMIPTQGQGLFLSYEIANSSIYGDFDYSLITADAYINYKFHEKFPVVIFGRVKSIMMLGDNPPPQDMPAITNDTPIYIAGNNILGTDEVVHLRGWNDWRLGDKLIFGSLETRQGNNKFILAQFVDFGNAWYAGQESDDWLFTGGYEVRVNIGFIVLAYGSAQDFNRWRASQIPYNYLRMTLVNPF
jgi:hypothetical protein